MRPANLVFTDVRAFRQEVERGLDHAGHLLARQVGAKAVVRPPAEDDDVLAVARDVEALGVFEDARVAVCAVE
jgi:hypothetical protein